MMFKCDELVYLLCSIMGEECHSYNLVLVVSAVYIECENI